MPFPLYGRIFPKEKGIVLITDMTEGKPGRMLWRFSIPMLASVMFQQFYNIADSVIAGRYAGEDALAAVGASYPITLIVMAVAVGCNVGCSVVVSQLFGEKDMTQLKTAVTTALFAVAGLSLLLTALGLGLSMPMMRALNTPANIFDDGALYLGIYIGGLPFLFLYNVCTGVFTALGDSRTPLYFLIGSSLGNIALDLWFVIAFDMGVVGVAWATFLAQGVSSVLALLALARAVHSIPTDEKPKRFSLPMLGRLSRMAVPSILQQSFVSVGNLFIQSLINGYGSAVIAGYSAAIKLNTFALTCFNTLGNGLSNFTAQNVGAGLTARVKKGFLAGVVMAVCVAAPFVALYLGWGDGMIRLFLPAGADSGATALAVGRRFLLLISPFYPMIAVKLMGDAVLRGAGAVGYFMITTFTDLVLRVVLSYLFSPALGTDGIWFSWPIGWGIAAVLSCVFYFSGVWKRARA